MEKKQIVKYGDIYCILQPVYYNHEERPAWRKAHAGSLEKCKAIFDTIADYTRATAEQERENRRSKAKEIIFHEARGDHKKAATIREQYHF